LNARVLIFSLLLSLAVGVLLGWAAALDAGCAPINESLRESALSVGMAKRVSRIHSVVVVTEIALTIILLASAGLLGRSFRTLARGNPGFRAHSALTFELTLPPAKYNSYDAQVAFYREAMERLNRAPGIAAAALVTPLPLSGNDESTVIHVEGDGLSFGSSKLPMAEYTVISANYFDALGVSTLEGRTISDTDTAQSLPVTVINESFAKNIFAGQDPLGRKVMLGSPRYPAMTVVGVVADTKVLNLRDRAPMGMYVPYTQHPYPSLETTQVVVRSAGPPLAAVGSVRDAIRELDSEQPVANVRTMDLLVADALTSERFLLFTIGQFASMALILSAIGIYGVLAYATSQRTREIGIRMALGAQRANVFGLILGRGFVLTLAGILLGLAGAWGATRVLAGLLFGVSATDPWTFAVVAAVLGGVAMLACYVPARRAMRVDPMVALRYE
jgi:putative ABC transport system permease protein